MLWRSIDSKKQSPPQMILCSIQGYFEQVVDGAVDHFRNLGAHTQNVDACWCDSPFRKKKFKLSSLAIGIVLVFHGEECVICSHSYAVFVLYLISQAPLCMLESSCCVMMVAPDWRIIIIIVHRMSRSIRCFLQTCDLINFPTKEH